MHQYIILYKKRNKILSDDHENVKLRVAIK